VMFFLKGNTIKLPESPGQTIGTALGSKDLAQLHYRETCRYGKNPIGRDNRQPSSKDWFFFQSMNAVHRLNVGGV